MTEKRFEPIADHNGFVEYIRDNAQKRIGLLTFDEFIDTANALHEENTQLKSSNMELEDYLARLEEENTRLLKANLKLTEENTNILNTIRTTYQTERTSLGRNTLKQLLDNIEQL